MFGKKRGLLNIIEKKEWGKKSEILGERDDARVPFSLHLLLTFDSLIDLRIHVFPAARNFRFANPPKGWLFIFLKRCLAWRGAKTFSKAIGEIKSKHKRQRAMGDGRWAAMLNIQPFTSLFLLATYTLSEDTSSFPRFPFSFRFNKYVLFRLLNPVLSSL